MRHADRVPSAAPVRHSLPAAVHSVAATGWLPCIAVHQYPKINVYARSL